MAEKKYLIENPDLMAEWDWEKNSEIGLNPNTLTAGSNKKAWWICAHNHSWLATIYHRSSKQKCPYCSNKKVTIGENDIQTLFPKLFNEWNYKRNLNISPSDLVIGSSKVVWWECSKCFLEWKSSIRSRTQKGTGCPNCAKKIRVASLTISYIKKNGTITNPLLLKEWNYQKNNGLTPEQFTPSSNRKVWWNCSKCHHEWEAKISNRNFGRGCPCCSNKTVVQGKNDLATTNPELSKEWHPTKNLPLTPHDVTIGSGKKVWWICINSHEYLASIMHRGHGTNCPICNSGKQTSFAEQAIFYYIKQIYPDAINRCLDILDNKFELDIYIPSIRVALEYDGSFWHKKTKSGDRERRKYQLCKSKGIILFRIREDDINATQLTRLVSNAVQYSDIKADIIFHSNSDGKNKNLDNLIQTILYEIDPECNKWSKSFSYKINTSIDINTKRDEYKIREYITKQELKSLKKLMPNLAKEWHPTKNGNTTPDMVTLGSDFRAWWQCSTCCHEWQTSVNHRANGTGCPKCYRINAKNNHPFCKKVVQYTTKGDFIKEWESISEASRSLSINSSNISMCAKHQRKKAGGFRWEYTTEKL